MKTKSMDMTLTRGLMKNMCLFILPLMLTGILQLLYTASDLIVCGLFGSEHSSGAISSTNSLINLIVNLFIGLSIGANVLMARCYGAKDAEKGQRVVYTAMALSAILGVAVGVVGSVCAKYFLQWLNTPQEYIGLSIKYLTIYFIGVPFTIIYNFGSALLRAVGDTRKPFYFLTASGVVNVLLNLLFVVVFRLDVPGVAIATSVSQFVAAALVVADLLLKKTGFFRFKVKEIRIYGKEALEIVRIGLPAGLQSVLFSVSNVMIQKSINDLCRIYGPALGDGNGASSSLEGFVYTAMNSCAQGAVTFASANYGAKNKKNIMRSILYALILVLAVWFVLSGVILLLDRRLLGLYVKDSDAVKWGRQRLWIILCTYFMCGFMDTFAFALRSIGYSVLPTVISTCGACGFRLIWIFALFPIDYFHNLKWLAISYPISWALTCAVHAVCFFVLFKKLKFPESEKAEPPQEPEESA